VHERHAGRGRSTRQVPGAVGVDHACLCRLALGPVDVGPGGTVDGGIGLYSGEGALNGGRLGYIELGARQSHELMARALTRAHDVAAEHPRGAGHEQPHVRGSKCRSCLRP